MLALGGALLFIWTGSNRSSSGRGDPGGRLVARHLLLWNNPDDRAYLSFLTAQLAFAWWQAPYRLGHKLLQTTSLPALTINLARSKERWDRISATALGSGVELERIEAVDGSSIAPAKRSDVDVPGFAKYHGRAVLDGEYGCYMSHLAALRRVVERGDDIAIITEDDIGFTPGLADRVRALFAASPKMELVKLFNHRTSGFVSHGRSALGDEFGRCMHGPQGSAACYAVTRQGAQKLVDALKPMWLPYDIAFERGWSTGVGTYTTTGQMVDFFGNALPTTIATRAEYHRAKLPKMQQIPTALFRGTDYVARSLYSFRKR